MRIAKCRTVGEIVIAREDNSRLCISGNRRVAVKIQKLTPETQSLIVEEYHILRDFTDHPNLPDFYGIYRRRSGKKSECDEIWLIMEVSFKLIEFQG